MMEFLLQTEYPGLAHFHQFVYCILPMCDVIKNPSLKLLESESTNDSFKVLPLYVFYNSTLEFYLFNGIKFL